MNETLVAPAIEAPTEAEAAFEALYRSSRDDVFAYVAGLLRDRSAAEDVTAQAFERAYRRRASFNPRRGTRRAWLFGIARNAALDELRRRRRHAELLAEPGARSGRRTPRSPPRRRCGARRSATAIADAARRASASWWRSSTSPGSTTPRSPTVIGISESNAGTRLHRVIEKLREACDEG